MSTELEVNIPLLRKAVEWVEVQAELPEIDREWAQESYLTPASNRAVALVYGALRTTDHWDLLSSAGLRRIAAQVAPHCGTAYCVAGWVAVQVDPRYITRDTVGGIHCSGVAQKALGLNDDQARMLFHGLNSADSIRRIAENIAGERL